MFDYKEPNKNNQDELSDDKRSINFLSNKNIDAATHHKQKENKYAKKNMALHQANGSLSKRKENFSFLKKLLISKKDIIRHEQGKEIKKHPFFGFISHVFKQSDKSTLSKKDSTILKNQENKVTNLKVKQAPVKAASTLPIVNKLDKNKNNLFSGHKTNENKTMPAQAGATQNNKFNAQPVYGNKASFFNAQHQNNTLANIKLHNAKDNDKAENELDVNFLPEQKKYPSKKTALFSYVSVLIMIFMLSFLPYYYYNKKNKQLNLNLKQLNEQINQINLKDKQLQQKVLSMGPFSQKLDLLASLLNKHIYWSNFFPILEHYTVGNVYYDSLKIDNKGKVILTGKAHTLHDFAEQFVILKAEPTFKNLKLLALSFVEAQTINDPKIEFSISYSIDKKLISASRDENNK